MYPDEILFGSTAEAEIEGARLGETQSAEKVRSKDGTINRARIARLAEHPILRLRKRRNSDGPEGPAPGYGLCVPQLIHIPIPDLESQSGP